MYCKRQNFSRIRCILENKKTLSNARDGKLTMIHTDAKIQNITCEDIAVSNQVAKARAMERSNLPHGIFK